MFKKSIKVKSYNQLRNCDRKSLRALVKQNYPILTDDDLFEIIPKRDDIALVKVETLYNGVVHVYTINRLPTLFLCGFKPFPTVYLLWRFPQLLPSFTTYVPVLAKLTDGADLMLPGVVYPNFKTMKQEVDFPLGTGVFVNLTTNKAAVAVGITIMTTNEMYKSRTGRCVNILHVHGDLLCTLNNITCAPLPELGMLELEEIEPSTSAVVDDGSFLITDCSELTDDEDPLDSYEEAEPEPEVEEEEPVLEYSDVDDEEELDFDNIPAKSTEFKSADDLLIHCFFACLKFKKAKIELPMLISKFYKNHILEKCPADQPLDIKKTSYKKLLNFLEYMEDLGVITMQKVKTGVYHISDIRYEHPCLIDFTMNPAYGPPKEKPQEVNKPQFSIAESHSVTAAVVQIFTQFGYSKGDAIDNTEIRHLVTEYVKQNNLQNVKDKNLVNVTPGLKAVFGLNPFMSWKNLFSKVYECMTPCYKITYGEKVFIRRGKLPTIDISVAKRSGNKKVTLVDNIEVYGIDLEEMSTHCQRSVAASSTINKSQTAKKGDQLQIQGNQVLFVHNVLTDVYSIPKRYIKGLEFAPKQKK